MTAAGHRRIVTTFDVHDHEQLILLAKMSRIKPAELIRRICRAYLDQGQVNLPRGVTA